MRNAPEGKDARSSEELRVRAHTHGSGAIERRVEHAIGEDRQLPDDIDRRHALQGSSRLQHHDRLRARGHAQRRHESARIADRFHVQQDAVGRGVVDERLEDLAEADVDPGAERHHRREPDVVRAREVEHGGAHGSGLRDEREPSGRASGAQNVAFNPMSVRTTPNAPGPSTRMRCARAGIEHVALPGVGGRIVAVRVGQEDRRLHLAARVSGEFSGIAR